MESENRYLSFFYVPAYTSYLRIRLYSTKYFKPLGTLKYHKSACQCLEFARSIRVEENRDAEEIDSDDEELSSEEKLNRSRWLFAGGKDNRVSIWPLMSFDKQETFK